MERNVDLAKTLAVLDQRLLAVKWPKNLIESRIDLFIATTAMTTKATELAKGVAVLTRFKAGHLGGALLLRALLEISTELPFLLRSSDADRSSSKAIIHGAFELLKFAEDAPRSTEAEQGTIQMRDLLDRRRGFQEDIVDEVIADRKKRRFHWSGKGHSAISREMTGSPLLYQALSWETHAAIAALQSFQVAEDGDGGGVLQFGGRSTAFLSDDALAGMTEAVIVKTWNDYATFWTLPILE